jgi:hypothetical protein
VPKTDEFQIDSTPGSYQDAAIATEEDGGFLVVWQSLTGWITSGDGVVLGRHFDSSGVSEGLEFQVSSATALADFDPAALVQADGGFVVAWVKAAWVAGYADVFVRRFDASDSPQGIEMQVNSYTSSQQRSPRVAADAAGGFVVAWESGNQDGSGFGVFARRFDSTGAPAGDEFQVNAFTGGDQHGPSIGSIDQSGFVVTWTSTNGQDGSLAGVFGQSFDWTGAPQAVEFQVNSSTLYSQAYPSIAFDDAGSFVVVWQGDGIRGQRFRFAVPATIDIDANGSLQAMTDGVLVLRSLFGFTGSAMSDGAVGAGCNRCNAAAVEPYLDGLGPTLDVDGSGGLDALTDGVLLLRYLFGFTGDALTSGVLAPDCSRCDSATIVSYLQTLD